MSYGEVGGFIFSDFPRVFDSQCFLGCWVNVRWSVISGGVIKEEKNKWLDCALDQEAATEDGKEHESDLPSTGSVNVKMTFGTTHPPNPGFNHHHQDDMIFLVGNPYIIKPSICDSYWVGEKT